MLKKRISNIEDFLSLLRGVKSLQNGQYLASCPSHNDIKPSLSIRSTNGKILVHCQAGCLTEAVVKSVGLSKSDLFLSNSTPKKRIVEIYPYHNMEGQLLFEVVRYEPKSFAQRRPDGNGGFIWNMTDINPVLYHLPDILRAIQYGDTIFVTEGEKDCDSLWGLGLVATCSPIGAGKWKPEYSDTLTGSKVNILQDSDEPGRNHALQVAHALYGKAKTIKLFPPFDSAEDISDWLGKEHTLEELEKIVSQCEPFNPNVYKYTNTSITPNPETQLDSGQVRDKFGTSSGQNWGFYARKFDEIMSESDGPQDKRDIAGQIGLKSTDDSFRRLLNRRKEEVKIRTPYRSRPNLIEWIKKDYKVVQLDASLELDLLDIKLPLDIHELVQIPPGSVIGIAGYTSAGKTAFMLEIAQLNVFSQPMPVYYWFNEGGEARFKNRCSDFPNLLEAQKQGKFMPVEQGDFEFEDVLHPNGINLIDYLDRDEELFLIGQDIKKLKVKINRGILVFALQKPAGRLFGYGGLPSAKLSNLYVALRSS